MPRFEPIRRLAPSALAVAILAIILSCGREENPVFAPDSTAPATISDLQATTVTASTVTLVWTAPGDDGNEGRATNYDVRYDTKHIDRNRWVDAIQQVGEPAPGEPGTLDSFTVAGLDSGFRYHFAVRTSDERPNYSNISNVTTATTR